MVLQSWSRPQGPQISIHRTRAPCPTPLDLLRAPCTSVLLIPHGGVLCFKHTVVILSSLPSPQLPLPPYNPPAPKSGKFVPPLCVSIRDAHPIPSGSATPGQEWNAGMVSPTEVAILASGFSSCQSLLGTTARVNSLKLSCAVTQL